MRIKEVAERAEVSTRLLRYYEEQGLLTPRREENGYRYYDDVLLTRVQQIRGLLNAGLTTEIIREVLPCLAEAADQSYPAPDFVSRIEHERDRMAERIAFLSKNKDALDAYLAGVASK